MKDRGRQDFQMKTLKENQQINRLQILTLNFNFFLFLFFASLASTAATAVLWGSYLSAISGSFCAVCVTLTIRVVRSGWFFVSRAEAVSDNSVFSYTSLNDSSNRKEKTNANSNVHAHNGKITSYKELTWEALSEKLKEEGIAEQYKLIARVFKKLFSVTEEQEDAKYILELLVLDGRKLNHQQLLQKLNQRRIENKRKPLSERAIKQRGSLRRLLDHYVKIKYILPDRKPGKYGTHKTVGYSAMDNVEVRTLKKILALVREAQRKGRLSEP